MPLSSFSSMRPIKQGQFRKGFVLFLFHVSVLVLFVGGVGRAAEPSRLVIFDDDFLGPAGTNLQAAALLLSRPDVKVLGLTVVTGDG